MNKNITYIIIASIILIVAGVVHYGIIKTKELPPVIDDPTYAEVIAAYNQGKIEGQNAMKNVIILEVLQKGEVRIAYKVNIGEKVEDRVIVLMEKNAPTIQPTE